MRSSQVTKMSSGMKMISFVVVFLHRGLWETEALSVTGVLGEEITIKCSHANAVSNVKYFCRGACENILISSQNNVRDSNEKYRIRDDGNTFYVTISHLTEHDTGTYWCGIERIGVDTYTEVVLTVIKGITKDPGFLNSNTPSSRKLAYTGAGLGVVLLALALVLLIFFRHRNRNTHASFEKDHDTVHATHSSQKPEGHLSTTSSSTANEDQETNSGTKNILSSTVQHRDSKADHIYSNVTVSPESQPDGLFYSTVSFNKHTGSSAATPHTAAITYSSIKHKATDESTVYDNV